jgi:uncharacterized lipoprotein YmbA
MTPMKTAPRFVAFVFVGISLLLAGCSALRPKQDPTRFYVLRPVDRPPLSTTNSTSSSVPSAHGTLRVGPGRIAGYLDSSPIITDDGQNLVRPLPFDHWAEPLGKGLERVLAGDLRQSLPLLNVVASSDSAAATAETRLAYEVTRFEGAPGREVVLEVSWTLRTSERDRAHPAMRFTVPAANAAEDVAGYVARLSRAIALWSDAVVRALP